MSHNLDWRPISDMPNAVKDGRPVMLANAETAAIAAWKKNGDSGVIGTQYKSWDAWCLLEVGAYAESDAISFEPTHFCEMGSLPDADCA